MLEIPQACVPDGPVMTCDTDTGDSAGSSAATASTSWTSSAIEVPDGTDPADEASTEPTTTDSSNIDEASSDPSMGNLQDYENQGIVEAPIAPVYVTGAERLAPAGPSGYFVPAVPMVLRPIQPLAIARPFGPGPWMIAPRFSPRPSGIRFHAGGGMRPFRAR